MCPATCYLLAATGALGGLAAASGGVAMTMVVSVQQFALLGGVSANLGSMYQGAACALQWANFQVRRQPPPSSCQTPSLRPPSSSPL